MIMAFDDRREKNRGAIPRRLLRWYGDHARKLPWRVGPAARRGGVAPDPYAVWLSEIMLQQTTVATVTPRFETFLTRWPTIRALAAAPLDDVLGEWAGLGYYARARNLHKCAGVVAEGYGGEFPDTEEALRALPGVGAYTAAAIAAIAFDRRAVVVDGNIERIMARLFAIETPLPEAKKEVYARAGEVWPSKRSGDFAQALMDLGATVCRPKSPICADCPIAVHCAGHASGRAGELPRKAAREAKPARRGAAFALINAKGEMLFERRPEKGLLGGMLGLPGTGWADAAPDNAFAEAPAHTRWVNSGVVQHVFTHFRLTLEVYAGVAPKGFRRARNQRWIKPETAQLPTVFRKAANIAVTD